MDNVVLDFKCIELAGLTGHEFSFDLKKATGKKQRNLGAVAFVQRTDNMDVLGAQATRIHWQTREEENPEPDTKPERIADDT